MSKAGAHHSNHISPQQPTSTRNVHLHCFAWLQVVTVDVEVGDYKSLKVGSGKRTALKMAWYPGNLVCLPRLSENLIFVGGCRMRDALIFMHNKKLAHMDVKPANILFDWDGKWLLCDFGSSTPFGEAPTSFTPVRFEVHCLTHRCCYGLSHHGSATRLRGWSHMPPACVCTCVWCTLQGMYPGPITTATAEVDWGLLLVTLMVLLCKDNYEQLKISDNRFSKSLVRRSQSLETCFGSLGRCMHNGLCFIYGLSLEFSCVMTASSLVLPPTGAATHAGCGA